MLNKVMIIGRLGRDPELRYSQTGMPIASLNIATDENYVDRDGSKVEKTEWHRVVVFQKAAENCANFLSKGSLVYIEGSLQTRKWQDQQGQDRYTTEIKAQRVQFLDRKGDGGARSGANNYDDQSMGGNDGGSQQRRAPRPAAQKNQSHNDDLGPAFPSEASGMDEVPF